MDQPNKVKKIVVDYFLALSDNPIVKAFSQLTPFSSAANSLFSGEYQRIKQEELLDVVHHLHSKIQDIDKKYIDKDFYATYEGKRAFAMAFSSLIRDSREQKIKAMSNLLVNITLKTNMTYDERLLFLDILDGLNPFQLTVLGRIYEFNKENRPNLRKIEPGGIADYFADKGISKQLTYQAISILANNYILNRDSSPVLGGGGLTHHFTDFGEKFYIFISTVLDKDSEYLKVIS